MNETKTTVSPEADGLALPGTPEKMGDSFRDVWGAHGRSKQPESKPRPDGAAYATKKVVEHLEGMALRDAPDMVNHPPHYTEHPSGFECIQITEHMSLNSGNATKYIWRADLKWDVVEDLKKTVWYLTRELDRVERWPDMVGAFAGAGETIRAMFGIYGCPAGITSKQITDHMGFNLGSAFELIYAFEFHGDEPERLREARAFVEAEIVKRTE